jgi:hypothetical protein
MLRIKFNSEKNILNSQWQKLVKIQDLPHLEFQNYEISFIKSYLIRDFQ